MTVFDLEKDDLLRLSPAQLEELIARLAEAEVASVGYGPGRVHRSGSIDAPDGGVDIRVVVPATELDTGFPARPDTIVQVKKSSMPPSAIKKEMRPGGTLSPAISRHALFRRLANRIRQFGDIRASTYSIRPRNGSISRPGRNSPIRPISHSSRIPEFSSTRARTVSPRNSRS